MPLYRIVLCDTRAGSERCGYISGRADRALDLGLLILEGI